MAAADQVDPHLRSALTKQRSGGTLTQREQNALRKFERLQREKYGSAYVRDAPKKDVLAESGVANKTWLEWSNRLDAPWQPHAKTANLYSLLRWACTIIAECSGPIHKHLKAKRSQAAVEEFLPDVAPLDWQEECFKEKAWELADKRLLRRRKMLHADAVAEIHNRIGARLQSFNDGLGKRYGEEAQRLFAQALEDIEADVMRLLAPPSSDDVIDDNDGRAA